MSETHLRGITPSDQFIVDATSGEIVGVQRGGVESRFLPGASLAGELAEMGVGQLAQVRRVALLGDSMAFAQNSVKTITAAARSGGVVTATVTSHTMSTGCYSAIVNMSPASLNATKTLVTVLDANTIQYSSPGPDVTAANLSASKAMALAIYQSRTDRGIGTWLMDMTQGAVECTINGGANGQTSADMLARLAEFVGNLGDIDDVVLLTGYNDFAVEHRTAEAVYADVTSIVGQLSALGKRGVVISALPWITGGTNTDRGEAARYNRLMSNYCATNYNTVFVDAARKLIDAASSTAFAAQAGMLNSDGIHPSTLGVYTVVTEVVAAAYKNYPTVSRLAQSVADTIGFNANSKNILNIGPWSNAAAGTAGTNVTGPVATGLNMSCSASGAAVASVVADADGTGYSQQAVFTSGGAAQWVRETLSAALTTGFSVGDKVRFMAQVELSNVSGSNVCGFNAIFTTNGYMYYASLGTQSDASKFPQVDRTYTFISDEVTLPAGTINLNFTLYLICGAAGSAVTKKVKKLTVLKS